MGIVRQSSFLSGEVAPQFYGSAPAGLKTAINVIPTHEGPLVNRPGTKFVEYVKTVVSSGIVFESARLLRFDYADGQNYLLELGDFYLRFHQQGAPVLVPAADAWSPVEHLLVAGEETLVSYASIVYVLIASVAAGGASPDTDATSWRALGAVDAVFEVVTPWAIADVMRVKSAQDGDVIRLTCVRDGVQYVPRKLTRYSAHNWAITSVVFTPPADFIASISPHYDPNKVGHDGPSAITAEWDSTTQYESGDYALAMSEGHAHEPAENYDNDAAFIATRANINTAPGVAGNSGVWSRAADSSHPAQPWVHGLTILYRDAFGATFETSIIEVTSGEVPIPSYTDRPVGLAWSALPTQVFSFTILGFNVYKGRSGVWGFIGTAEASETSFSDNGIAPDYSTIPPKGDNPFAIGGSTSGDKTYSWPAVVANHEQRVVYARSDRRPQDFVGSNIGDGDRFDQGVPTKPSDTFTWKPASERLEELRALVSLDHLLLFSVNGEWSAHGGQSTIGPSNVILRRIGRNGSGWLDPVVVGEGVVFQTARGRVRALTMGEREKWIPRDLSMVSRHLFDQRQIIDWAYAESPFGVVWAVRDDGVLLSLTYSPGGPAAWVRHVTSGQVERVQAVLEEDPVTGATEDAVYIIVRRGTRRLIERFASRLLETESVYVDDEDGEPGYFTQEVNIKTACFLDSAGVYDGRNTGAISVSTGTPSTSPTTLTASAALFALSDVGRHIIVDPDGTPYLFLVTAFTSTTAVTVEMLTELDEDADPIAFSGTDWAWAANKDTVISAIAHLEGRVVNALVDGVTQGPFVVQGSTLQNEDGDAELVPGVDLVIGLPYNSDVELLDIGAEGASTKVKSVAKVSFKLSASRGLLMGETLDPDKLHRAIKRTTGDPRPPPLFTGDVDGPVLSTWNNGGRVALRQSDPLPFTLSAVSRDVVVGG